ncbi:MAG: trypsin-like peptidase domain-containing protein [Verrucomicrobia bacterium]|nr:trypsin-like peptidase domain-containing protein [Verrucomicrobiota bacterium]
MKLTLALLAAACLALAAQPAPGYAASPNLDLARQLNQAFIEVAEKVSPAVVVITVVQKPATPPSEDDSNGLYDSMPREFWRYFHKQFDQQLPEKVRGEGSGIIIREDGYILTNCHVVDNAQSIRVRLKDGRRFKAQVRGLDPKSDLAVLKIEASRLPVAALADSAKTRVGEFAIAIGTPFDLDYTVTIGHVSAKGRSNVLQGYGTEGMDQDFIQTDALINPGNSGGPLLNIDGEVIGINTLIRGMHSGIGFAVPSSLAKEISDRLIAEGKFKRAWLGIAIRALRDEPDAGTSAKGVEDGVVVQQMVPGGPAANSELEQGDIITAVEGRQVATAQQLRGEIRGRKIGQLVTLDVYRPDPTGHGKMIQVTVRPSEWIEPPTVIASTRPSPGETAVAGLGLTVHPLSSELAKQFGVSSTQGVVVVAVDGNTPAARKGIKPGDVITSVNKQAIATPKQFRDALKGVDLKKGVAVKLLSGGTPRVEVLKEGKD